MNETRKPNPWWEFTHTERRALVKDGGTIAWWEHSLAWDAYFKQCQNRPVSSDDIEAHGGFALSELASYLNRKPRTYVA